MFAVATQFERRLPHERGMREGGKKKEKEKKNEAKKSKKKTEKPTKAFTIIHLLTLISLRIEKTSFPCIA